MENETVLVGRAVTGDETAFEALLEAHKDMVYNVAYRMLGNTADAEDAFQETFVSAYKSISRFRSDARFSTWLYRIAVNRCRDMISARRSRPAAESIHGDSFDVAAPDRGKSTEVEDALRFVTPEYREAITLHCLLGYSYEEAGGIMGAPEGTVKTYVHRGKEELRKILAGERQ